MEKSCFEGPITVIMVNRITIGLVLIIGICLVPVAMFGQSGITRKTPKNAIHFEDNNFIAWRELQVIHAFERVEEPEPPEMARDVFSYQITYGMFQNYEIGTRIPVYYFKQQERGVADISLFQRFKFSDSENYPFDSSGGFELILPTGEDRAPVNRPTGTERLNGRLFFSMGSPIGTGRWWTAQGAVTYYGQEDIKPENEFGFAFSHRIISNFRGILEFNMQEDGRQEHREAYVSPGVWMNYGRGLSTTVSAQVGMNEEAAESRFKIQLINQF